jgi:hypothetical protein
MSSPAPAAAGLALACIASALAACTSMSRVKDEPPPGVTLAGNWQLDTHLSTDTRTALRQLVRPSHKRPQSDAAETADSGDQGPPSGARGGRPVRQYGLESNDLPPDISLQLSLLAGGDFLKIEQRPEEFVIGNGETTRSFVPGEKSVVSVPSGVADQESGWKGKQYWIEIKPQVGPRVIERLHLSDKGDQLIETIDVSGEGRVKALHVTRVYNPTRDVPIVLPGEN